MNAQTITTDIMENKSVRIAAIGLLLALLSACGSEVTPRTGSLYSTSGPSGTLVNSTGGQAECSTFDSVSTRLGGKVTTYYRNNVIQEDKVRVRITSLIEAFDTNPNYYIQAFRWKINGSGVAEIDNTAVQFQFENGAGSDVALNELSTSVSLRGISAIRTAKGITGTGSVDFFSRTTMVVNGVDYNWQALKFVVYDGTTTPSTIVGSSDFLLPIFQANPNTYAASHSATLTALHPFISQAAQTLTESDWASRTTSFCF